jgi:NADH dehydrogenase [ubiquinone] 1 alpha subcomplex assembly factor 1
MSTSKIVIFDFNSNATISNWQVVNDGVMGGKSKGSFKINETGFGEFSGVVSLENNGGFSSLRYGFEALKTEGLTTIILRVKGDGNTYQFRIKDAANNRHSYMYEFSTKDNEWQDIRIPLKSMFPVFRGRKLEMDNFSAHKIEQIVFLIGNKIAQKFKLEIDTIYLQ